ncbi:alpha/beta fold hydrolase [Halomonas sp. M1]|uniref:alpha/beta fold hydrolase n=1 Tax=Halomonas sp. M1 TaxID=3035470 RepID=UPI002486B31A|nr:alpha/beta fold hydrolase [Halomonas sp. M1]WFE70962.1 alpha/beta fold hydrolase [Halomonas sp. M1]
MPRLAPQRLVLLSGWGVDQRIWQPLADYWPDGSEVSRADWPGYGDVAALPEPATLTSLAHAMADQLPSDAVWVGWSLGGLLATALLDHLPAPRGLILIGAGERFCSDDGVSTAELATFQRAFARDPNATWQHFLRWQSQGEPNARHAYQQLRTLLGDTPSATPSTLSQGLHWLATLDNTQRLQDTPCPVSRLVGEHDPLVDSGQRAQAARLAHAGHCPMLSQPAELAGVITEHAATLTQQAVKESP